ncbi:TIGR04222 domain-containing membrane protein [Rhodococcus sp. IEGM 1379]|uniref:TIGR04222 domain-containing membrane protein n=1 Tax=Rhodococcus sp. IEGM 1379 TaxID=3047086 RepID=UPI0024B829DD|nr:TIGR04222 domain-containing membrane protein [Rhodococcus sp. IEGM 1379]MDI9915970.1 TIGR04222 domain-containing membrane protein [Rhodococcus sp. IEGM 1379]
MSDNAIERRCTIHNHTDTWGVSPETFLQWYVVAASGALVISLLIRGAATRKHAPTPRPLTPPEMGVLTSDFRAVQAAVAEGSTAGHRDRFTRIVRARVENGGGVVAPSQLVSTLSLPLLELRSGLVRDGYLNGNRVRSLIRLSRLPVVIVIIVGVFRIVFCFVNGNAAGYLPLVVATLAIAAARLLRLRRRTRFGDAELRRLADEYSYLSPRSRPSFATYGPMSAEIAAALFGPGRQAAWSPGCGSESSPSSCSSFTSSAHGGG